MRAGQPPVRAAARAEFAAKVLEVDGLRQIPCRCLQGRP